MLKKILVVALLLPLIGISGCTSGSSTDTSASMSTIRESKIGTQWNMKQLQIKFKTDTSVTIELASGDKVDGYFYAESGDSISLVISGISQIYTSPTGAISDRFSFTASQAQGIDYKLKFSATGKGTSESTVFLEIIYPATGLVLVPIGTK